LGDLNIMSTAEAIVSMTSQAAVAAEEQAYQAWLRGDLDAAGYRTVRAAYDSRRNALRSRQRSEHDHGCP
jgi:hypothetical protein